MRFLRPVLLTLLLTGMAGAAHAGSLTLTYNLGGGGSGFQYNGDIDGFVTFTVPASSPTVVTSGVGTINTMILQSPGGFTVFGTGLRTGISVFPTVAGNEFMLTTFGVGGYAFGGLSLNIVNLATPSGLTGFVTLATFTIFSTGPYGTPYSGTTLQSFSFAGFEVGRSFVPEPATGSLVAIALGGLALAGAGTGVLRRRRS